MRTNKPSNLLILVILIGLLSFLMISCTVGDEGNDDSSIVVSPTEAFVVNEYIQDNMILQKNASNYFSGQAEPQVKIIIDIKNSKNQVVSTASTITDKSGNWQVKVDSPENGKSSYNVLIYDSFNKYKKEYQNIVFGNLFVIIGEQMFFNTKVATPSIDKYQNIRLCSKEGIWYQNTDPKFANQVTTLIDRLVDKADGSITGFIDLTFQSTSIGSFMKNALFDREPDLREYNTAVYELLSENDERESTYHNSELAETYLNKFFKVNCHTLITYQGLTDYYSGIDFGAYAQKYAKSLSIFLKDLKNNFNYKNLLVIETPSITYDESIPNINNIALLRDAQSTAAYYNNGKIIPTYKFGNNYQDEVGIHNFTVNLVNHLFSRISSASKTPSYANLIIKKDELIIEINNCFQLEEVDEINNFLIYDQNGQVVNDKYQYYVVDNYIVVRAIDDLSTIKDISLIFYNFQADISMGNLYNEENEMVNPFKIVIESEE